MRAAGRRAMPAARPAAGRQVPGRDLRSCRSRPAVHRPMSSSSDGEHGQTDRDSTRSRLSEVAIADGGRARSAGRVATTPEAARDLREQPWRRRIRWSWRRPAMALAIARTSSRRLVSQSLPRPAILPAPRTPRTKTTARCSHSPAASSPGATALAEPNRNSAQEAPAAMRPLPGYVHSATESEAPSQLARVVRAVAAGPAPRPLRASRAPRRTCSLVAQLPTRVRRSRRGRAAERRSCGGAARSRPGGSRGGRAGTRDPPGS